VGALSEDAVCPSVRLYIPCPKLKTVRIKATVITLIENRMLEVEPAVNVTV